MELNVGGKYCLTKNLGKGNSSYGLYAGYNMKTKEEVAIKVEKIRRDLPRML